MVKGKHAVRYAIFPVRCPIPKGMAFLSACIAQPCYGWLPLSDAYGIILIPIVCQKKEQKVEKEIECYDGGARPEQREGHGSKKIFFFFA